ncbi:MAG TPA: hypothetical protein VGM60_05445 [Pseudonocardia sp.]|jgi:hypothetical protein|uniref:hypothetical protein n=1 Tax=Pseudonocardia sp. TaxID=60912 RepID=UPI002F42C64A
MADVPLWQTLLGLAGILAWGLLCGAPALAIYSLAARPRAGAASWVLLAVLVVVWFPLVTALCVWAVSTVVGLKLS